MDTIEEFEKLVIDKCLADEEVILGKYYVSITSKEKPDKKDREMLIITNKRFFINSNRTKVDIYLSDRDTFGVVIFIIKNIKSISTLVYNSDKLPKINMHYFDGNCSAEWGIFSNHIELLFFQESDAQEAFEIFAKNMPL